MRQRDQLRREPRRAIGVSGTIGAALEADVYGIPAMAAAITAQTSEWHTFGELDWSAARHFTGLGRTASGRG